MLEAISLLESYLDSHKSPTSEYEKGFVKALEMVHADLRKL